MKVIGSIALLFLMILGLERAFFFKEPKIEILSTRQKIEITYRNAFSLTANEESLKLIENEIQELVKNDPFLNKKDRKWAKEKLKTDRKSVV